MAQCSPSDSRVAIVAQLNSRRAIKICPDCAIKHFARCQNRDADGDQEACSRCDALSSWAPGGVSLVQMVLLAFRSVSAMTGAVFRVGLALLAATQFLVKLVFYAIASVKWVRQESNTPKAVVKGVACGVAAVSLCYIAWVLIFLVISPSLSFVYNVLGSGYSLI